MKKYLDADLVQQRLKELCEKYSVQYGAYYDSFGKAIAEFTGNFSAEDVRENVREEWKKFEYPDLREYYCICCHYMTDNRYNFCPNCGAEMK